MTALFRIHYIDGFLHLLLGNLKITRINTFQEYQDRSQTGRSVC